MSDLTQRLRAWAHDERLGHGPLLLDAAAEIERQRQLIEDIDASGIHSCHDRCQRLECVQRREIERLRQQLGMPLDTERENERVFRAAHRSSDGPHGGQHITEAGAEAVSLREKWFYTRHWLRAQICKLRGHRLETGHHLSASLYCVRCGRVQFYYHRQGLIVPASATLEDLNRLGIKNP